MCNMQLILVSALVFSTCVHGQTRFQVRGDIEENALGKFQLKSSVDPHFCAGTTKLEGTVYSLKLIECLKERPQTDGENDFHLYKVKDEVYQIRTVIMNGRWQEYRCLYPETNQWDNQNPNQFQVITAICQNDNPRFYWTFSKLRSSHRHHRQVLHKATGKCLQAPYPNNGTLLTLVPCKGVEDKGQIWHYKFLYYADKWLEVGKMRMKPSIDTSFCMQLKKHPTNYFSVELDKCSNKNSEQSHRDTFHLGKTQGRYYQIKSQSQDGLPSEIGLASGGGCWITHQKESDTKTTKVVSDFNAECDYNDREQYWQFIEVSPKHYLLVNRNSQKCIRATDNKKSVDTANCNRLDKHQVWIREFVE